MVSRTLRVQENKTLASSSSSSSSSSCSSSSSPFSGSFTSNRHTTDFNQITAEVKETRIQENKTLASSSSTPSRNWEHDVFVSFRGEDVRSSFLSHILKDFRRKGINPFMDDEMKKGASISPELIHAIEGSKIAIVLLSKNYASSSWCLNELVKIIECRRNINQEVITIFYQVEPTDVRKQAGEFGKVFKKTCKGKTPDVVDKWREALTEVGSILGYDSTKWANEASAIEEVANNISQKLNHLASSHNWDHLIGMETHMKEMQSLLRLDSEDEVRMIGIWGPPGIGKSTMCRYLHDQLSSSNFQLTALMVNIKQSYPNPCLDEGSAQLQLQKDMLSLMFDQKNIVITHLGTAQNRLKDKRVLLVLDDVDQHAQLVALAEDNHWFGPGSRIIIVTEDLRVLLAHGIKIDRIYNVNYPSDDEALQMFCTYAFGQKFPDDGFTELARKVTYRVGNLPLGLKIMGSYFLRRPKNEWIEALPNLWSCLDGKIESVLKFSYDALSDEYKDLFLHIACYFNYYEVEKVEAYLAGSFANVKTGLQVLSERSLISFEYGHIQIHKSLAQLGQEIVSKQSRKQFVSYDKDLVEVLEENTSIRSLQSYVFKNILMKTLIISERTFEGMSKIQILTTTNSYDPSFLSSVLECLNDVSSKLRLIDWSFWPMTYWPWNEKLEFLVELNMSHSKLKKLGGGIKALKSLKWMDLSYSENLRELPNFSTALKILNLSYCSSLVELPYSIGNATNLQDLDLNNCSSLVKLPYSIGNAINLQTLNLRHCSSLLELPYSIGNATNIKKLILSHCSSLVELPSSIGNLHKLPWLILQGCSKLKVLPTNINMEILDRLDLTDCYLLKIFPEISTNISYLNLIGTAVEEVPSSIRSWSRLNELHMSYNERLMEMSHAFDTITKLDLTGSEEIQKLGTLNKVFTHLPKLVLNGMLKLVSLPQLQDSPLFIEEIKELGTWIKGFTRLHTLVLNGMRKLVSLPQLPDSLGRLEAENCESLETLDCSFRNKRICLNFRNCFKLNQEARDLIIQTSTNGSVILPGREVPTYFNFRAFGNTVMVKLNEKDNLDKSRRYRACVLLVTGGDWKQLTLSYSVESKYDDETTFYRTYKGSEEGTSSENLFIFDVETEEVTSTELVFEFGAMDYTTFEDLEFEIKECGVVQISELYSDEDTDYDDKIQNLLMKIQNLQMNKDTDKSSGKKVTPQNEMSLALNENSSLL